VVLGARRTPAQLRKIPSHWAEEFKPDRHDGALVVHSVILLLPPEELWWPWERNLERPSGRGLPLEVGVERRVLRLDWGERATNHLPIGVGFPHRATDDARRQSPFWEELLLFLGEGFLGSRKFLGRLGFRQLALKPRGRSVGVDVLSFVRATFDHGRATGIAGSRLCSPRPFDVGIVEAATVVVVGIRIAAILPGVVGEEVGRVIGPDVGGGRGGRLGPPDVISEESRVPLAP
jgi:hypothetical protein